MSASMQVRHACHTFTTITITTATTATTTTTTTSCTITSSQDDFPSQDAIVCGLHSTGWLTHWGEAMANTSAVTMASTLRKILAWGHGTGSVSLYMAHGGTNFGYWAGQLHWSPFQIFSRHSSAASSNACSFHYIFFG
jgi:hypothetical protein